MTSFFGRSNEERVRRLLDALGAGDDATVLDMMDPAIELVPLAGSAGLLAEPYRGLDGLRAFLGDPEASDVERGFVARHVRATGNTVVVFGHVHPDGDARPAPAFWTWRLRDGLVTHGTVVADGSAPHAGDEWNLVDRAPLWLELPATTESVTEARHAFRVWADGLPLTKQEREDILLAVSEAASNVVRHAYPGGADGESLRMQAAVEDGRLVVSVEDDGVGLGSSSADPGLGMGLPLLRALTEAVGVVSAPERPGGVEVRMRFAVASMSARGGA